MDDEKIQMELLEEIYNNQSKFPPYREIELDLTDAVRAKNFNRLVNDSLVSYPRKTNDVGEYLTMSNVYGIFRDSIYVTAQGGRFYHDLHFKYEPIILERKRLKLENLRGWREFFALGFSIVALVISAAALWNRLPIPIPVDIKSLPVDRALKTGSESISPVDHIGNSSSENN